jgi:hypothetical protein
VIPKEEDLLKSFDPEISEVPSKRVDFESSSDDNSAGLSSKSDDFGK